MSDDIASSVREIARDSFDGDLPAHCPVDDVLGFRLYVARIAGVTRHLEVEYLEPLVTGVPYVVRPAWTRAADR